jgi:hypothetical protein
MVNNEKFIMDKIVELVEKKNKLVEQVDSLRKMYVN